MVNEHEIEGFKAFSSGKGSGKMVIIYRPEVPSGVKQIPKRLEGVNVILMDDEEGTVEGWLVGIIGLPIDTVNSILKTIGASLSSTTISRIRDHYKMAQGRGLVGWFARVRQYGEDKLGRPIDDALLSLMIRHRYDAEEMLEALERAHKEHPGDGMLTQLAQEDQELILQKTSGEQES